MRKILALCWLFIALTAMSFHPFRPVAAFEGTIQFETSSSGEVPKAISDKLGSQYVLLYKGADLKIKGSAPLKAEFLIKNETSRMYIIRADQKNIYEVDLQDKRLLHSAPPPNVTRLKETLTIAGYVCQKYELQYEKGVKVYAWTTPMINVGSSRISPLAATPLQLPPAVEGFPLKLQMTSASFSIACTATVVKTTPLDTGEFGLPAGMTLRKL